MEIEDQQPPDLSLLPLPSTHKAKEETDGDGSRVWTRRLRGVPCSGAPRTLHGAVMRVYEVENFAPFFAFNLISRDNTSFLNFLI